MAQIIDRTTNYKLQKPPRTLSRSSCFMGCCGGSSCVSSENKQFPEKGDTVGMKKTRTRWLTWSRLKNKSFPRKTVPIDGNTDEKVHPKKGNIFLVKSSKKLLKDQSPGLVTEKNVHDKPHKTKYDNVQEITLENCNSMNNLDSMKKGLSAISKSTSQKSISKPTSPEHEIEVSQGKVALLNSFSMPPPMRKKTVNVSGGHSKVNITSQRKTEGSRFDQFVGVSIIMVTLIIMIFFGKIYAILGTSAWFYFYPLVRGKNEPQVGEGNGPKSELDFNSQEYKKKVVLDGFLERNHRIH